MEFPHSSTKIPEEHVNAANCNQSCRTENPNAGPGNRRETRERRDAGSKQTNQHRGRDKLIEHVKRVKQTKTGRGKLKMTRGDKLLGALGCFVWFRGKKWRLVLQKAYREEGKKDAGCSLYSQMPQTIETVFARELIKTQSDVSLTLICYWITVSWLHIVSVKAKKHKEEIHFDRKDVMVTKSLILFVIGRVFMSTETLNQQRNVHQFSVILCMTTGRRYVV